MAWIPLNAELRRRTDIKIRLTLRSRRELADFVLDKQNFCQRIADSCVLATQRLEVLGRYRRVTNIKFSRAHHVRQATGDYAAPWNGEFRFSSVRLSLDDQADLWHWPES